MSLAWMEPTPLRTSNPSAHLFNEGLDPGVRVLLDDRRDLTATVCFAESDCAYAHVRMDGTGERLRLPSWRLALIS